MEVPQIIHFFLGFSIVNHLFVGTTIYGNLHITNFLAQFEDWPLEC